MSYWRDNLWFVLFIGRGILVSMLVPSWFYLRALGENWDIARRDNYNGVRVWCSRALFFQGNAMDPNN